MKLADGVVVDLLARLRENLDGSPGPVTRAELMLIFPTDVAWALHALIELEASQAVERHQHEQRRRLREGFALMKG